MDTNTETYNIELTAGQTFAVVRLDDGDILGVVILDGRPPNEIEWRFVSKHDPALDVTGTPLYIVRHNGASDI